MYTDKVADLSPETSRHRWHPVADRNFSVIHPFFWLRFRAKSTTLLQRIGPSTVFVEFLRGGCSRGGNWGTLRIPREDWGTLGKIREPPPLGTPPLNNPSNINGGPKLMQNNSYSLFAARGRLVPHVDAAACKQKYVYPP